MSSQDDTTGTGVFKNISGGLSSLNLKKLLTEGAIAGVTIFSVFKLGDFILDRVRNRDEWVKLCRGQKLL